MTDRPDTVDSDIKIPAQGKGDPMSLVNQFEITLKDFLPDLSDGMIIADRTRRTTTTVSNRLYARLRAYADDNQLPLGAVVDQLRDEIHQQPAAMKFAKGDRVKLSAEGIQIQISQRGSLSMPADRSGTVAHNSQEKFGVAVRWDGTKFPQYIS